MNNYTFGFVTHKPSKEIFELLLDINQWWLGIYEETITGNSQKLNDEFSFSAGGGAHYTNQKLIKLVPYTKIVWQVTESNLSFLHNTKEWENTKLAFDILEKEGETRVRFTHIGLEPQIECYNSCSTAWTKYLQNLEEKLKSI